jgi:hypothetical protein
MAPARKRNSSNFIPKPKTEEVEIEKFVDEVATEMFETISRIEEEPVPAIIESIVPTEDVGPRFVEEPAKEVIAPTAVASAPVSAPAPQQLTHPPKRHPRNIPKFTPYKPK